MDKIRGITSFDRMEKMVDQLYELMDSEPGPIGEGIAPERMEDFIRQAHFTAGQLVNTCSNLMDDFHLVPEKRPARRRTA